MPESNRIENKQQLTKNLEKEVGTFLNYYGSGIIYLVEQLGSGVPRILKYDKKNYFLFPENFIRMTFPLKENVVEPEQKIIEILFQNKKPLLKQQVKN